MTSAPDSPDRHLTIHQSARLIGGFCWVEQRAFEVLGAWSAVEPDDGAALAFASASLRHGEQAELWSERLPSARGFATGDLVVAPSPTAEQVMGALSAIDESLPTERRLEAWFGTVLPALIDAYSSVHEEVSSVAEAPIRRACDRALDDDRREAATGLVLLGAMDRPSPVVSSPGGPTTRSSGPQTTAPDLPPLGDGACFLANGAASA